MAEHAKTNKEGEPKSSEPVPPTEERLAWLDEREDLLEVVARLETQVKALHEQLQVTLDTLEQLLSPPMLQGGDSARLIETVRFDKTRNEQQKSALLKELATERVRKGAELREELRKHRQELKNRMQSLRRKPKA